MKGVILEEGGDVLQHSAVYSEVRSAAQNIVLRGSVECLLKVHRNKNLVVTKKVKVFRQRRGVACMGGVLHSEVGRKTSLEVA